MREFVRAAHGIMWVRLRRARPPRSRRPSRMMGARRRREEKGEGRGRLSPVCAHRAHNATLCLHVGTSRSPRPLPCDPTHAWSASPRSSPVADCGGAHTRGGCVGRALHVYAPRVRCIGSVAVGCICIFVHPTHPHPHPCIEPLARVHAPRALLVVCFFAGSAPSTARPRHRPRTLSTAM
ncbi:hypothetical protein B0H15DRAFT_942027 [Mycena belliarum]|uniref:Uncharacterized protein n=1 Tax=Mycena belliarum TaxID=1033014 RepID=A0AAD6XY17_9AGAR|nr:hypothetical protein B0H15DRAFT_942027 [Mycena belliae]